MSGGHYNYAYHHVQDFADACVLPMMSWDDIEIGPREHLELRERFSKHLKKVAEAMRVIEWADSGDMGDDDVKRILTEFFA